MAGTFSKDIRLFRMVHYANIAHILVNGMTCRSHYNADPNYINIGDSNLIAKRNDYEVPIPPAGTLGQYVPFYFAGRSPMLLNIKTGYRGMTQRAQDEIVYFVCKLTEIINSCNEWVYTDGHAKDKLTEFFNNIGLIEDVIDWNIVKERWWTPTEEDLDRQRRKQAEFLVKSHVPVSCIEGIIVKNDSRKQYVEDILSRLQIKLPIKVDNTNKYYYP
jgi:hypothetical protein